MRLKDEREDERNAGEDDGSPEPEKDLEEETVYAQLHFVSGRTTKR